jgi:hypothetical protein
MTLKRIAAVTAGLVATGAVAGAILGALVMGLEYLAIRRGDLGTGLFFGALFGALLGSVLAPAAAWLLLRRVALGRALAQTFLGGMLGAIVSLLAMGGGYAIPGALLGFTLAAVRLRLTGPKLGPGGGSARLPKE